MWKRSVDTHGYGQFYVAGVPFRSAHKWAWVFEYGKVPDLCVLHKCDNPRCVNPDHLFLGTQQENIADKVRKGRQPKGMSAEEMCRNAVLTREQVLAISRDERPHKEIAAAFGVSVGAVAKIKSGERWAWLTRPKASFEPYPPDDLGMPEKYKPEPFR